MLGQFPDGGVGFDLLSASKADKTDLLLAISSDGSAALRVSDKGGRSVTMTAASDLAGIGIADTGKTTANFSMSAQGAVVTLNGHIIR